MYLCPKIKFCAKRASKIIVPPQEMLFSFSIGTLPWPLRGRLGFTIFLHTVFAAAPLNLLFNFVKELK